MKCVEVSLKYDVDVVVTVNVPDDYDLFQTFKVADDLFKSNIDFAYDDKMIDDATISRCRSASGSEVDNNL